MFCTAFRTSVPRPTVLRRSRTTPCVFQRTSSRSSISKMAAQAAPESSFWDGVSIFQLFTPIAAHYNGIAFDHVKQQLSSESPFILDLACGNGLLALEAAKALPHATVLGVDISENQINGAQARAAAANLGNLEYKVMDGQDLQLEDNSVDAIACMFGVMYFGDQDKSWREMYRVLKPGGIAVVGTWREPPFIGFYERADAQVRGSDQVIQLPAFAESRNLKDPDQLQKQAMSAAPFREVQTSVEECTWKPWPIVETATGVGKMLATPMFPVPADLPAEEFKAALTQEMLGAVDSEGMAALPCVAVVAVAHK